MTRRIPTAERRDRLARRHRLLAAERIDDVARIADDLVALHSTDPVGVYLSAAARMRTPSLAAVDRALYDDRNLVRHHAMRRTLWVATPATARLMHAAATRKLIGPERRRTLALLADARVAQPESWLERAATEVLGVLEREGPLTARTLGQRVPGLRLPLRVAAGTPAEGTTAAHSRVLLQLGFEGRVLRGRPQGSWVNGAYAYADAAGWIEGGVDDPGLGELDAAVALAGRWLRRFGPGTTEDLRWWTGWTLTLTRAALAGAAAVAVETEDGPAWVAAGDEAPAEPVGPWVAVLPALDPSVMGWKQRTWYLPARAAAAFDRNGNAGPTLWVDGEVVGAWAQAKDGTLRCHWFGEVPAPSRKAVLEELDRLGTLLGPTRFSVRFPAAVQRSLLR